MRKLETYRMRRHSATGGLVEYAWCAVDLPSGPAVLQMDHYAGNGKVSVVVPQVPGRELVDVPMANVIDFYPRRPSVEQVAQSVALFRLKGAK